MQEDTVDAAASAPGWYAVLPTLVLLFPSVDKRSCDAMRGDTVGRSEESCGRPGTATSTARAPPRPPGPRLEDGARRDRRRREVSACHARLQSSKTSLEETKRELNYRLPPQLLLWIELGMVSHRGFKRCSDTCCCWFRQLLLWRLSRHSIPLPVPSRLTSPDRQEHSCRKRC